MADLIVLQKWDCWDGLCWCLILGGWYNPTIWPRHCLYPKISGWTKPPKRRFYCDRSQAFLPKEGVRHQRRRPMSSSQVVSSLCWRACRRGWDGSSQVFFKRLSGGITINDGWRWMDDGWMDGLDGLDGHPRRKWGPRSDFMVNCSQDKFVDERNSLESEEQVGSSSWKKLGFTNMKPYIKSWAQLTY